jgi:asparagine synthase (glutamine-hydrolysing)
LYDRPKQGFTAPLKTWFAAELRDELNARLATAHIERMGGVSARAVARILDDHQRGVRDHTQLLWALFLLDRWFEAYIDTPISS